MATDTVEIIFSHPHRVDADTAYEVGARAAFPPLEAKNLVRAGVATYATKVAATDAEGPAGEEKTARAVKAKSSTS